MRATLLNIVILFTAVNAWAQSAPKSNTPLICDTLSTSYYNCVWWISSTDTIVQASYAPVMIYANSTNRHKKNQYDRLQQKVIKTYPYAKAAGDIMDMFEIVSKQVTDPKVQNQLLDQAENELKKQFEKDLRDMTVSEGVILIKLIDRETGNSSFKLVQDLKGKFSAFMWQSVARVFGHNLKDQYDPAGKDVWIENIVVQIEDGTIPVQLKQVDPFGMGKLAKQ